MPTVTVRPKRSKIRRKNTPVSPRLAALGITPEAVRVACWYCETLRTLNELYDQTQDFDWGQWDFPARAVCDVLRGLEQAMAALQANAPRVN